MHCYRRLMKETKLFDLTLSLHWQYAAYIAIAAAACSPLPWPLAQDKWCVVTAGQKLACKLPVSSTLLVSRTSSIHLLDCENAFSATLGRRYLDNSMLSGMLYITVHLATVTVQLNEVTSVVTIRILMAKRRC